MAEKVFIADMHTHSEHSHDSICPIEDMCISQIGKGTEIFAVTDHCDVFSFDDYDIYAPIKNAHATVEYLNKKYGDKCTILSGVEVSEGFWFQKEYEKIHNLVPYDVIIGSVHCVKCRGFETPYSKIDFSVFSEEQLYTYLGRYFDDIRTMIFETDFDILAHLTCPIRYITGKYGRKLEIDRFEDKILSILNSIIERGIALEVNTSGYGVLKEFMPSKEILNKYYNLGGRLITLGSDAHIAENASSSFAEAIETVKEIGFENICYFKNRKINQIKI